MSSSAELRCVLVGDSGAGQTCAVMRYAGEPFPAEWIPTLGGNDAHPVRVGERTFSVVLVGTSGRAEYDELRPLAYANADVILLCFSLASAQSLASVSAKWKPEIDKHAPGVPLVLVGMKSDLRENEEPDAGIATKGRVDAAMSPAAMEALAKEIGVAGYRECSALTASGLQLEGSVFATAVQATKAFQKKKCAIM